MRRAILLSGSCEQLDQEVNPDRHGGGPRHGDKPCADDVLGRTPPNRLRPFRRADAHDGGADHLGGRDRPTDSGRGQDHAGRCQLGVQGVYRPNLVDAEAKCSNNPPAARERAEGDRRCTG